MKDIILSCSQPHEHVRHFYRIESQLWGSLYAHGVLGIDDAADVEYSSIDAITAFVDKYTQCSNNNE